MSDRATAFDWDAYYSGKADQKKEQEIIDALKLRIVDTGYKKLALTFHPDIGGSHEDMQRLNKARDGLREQAGLSKSLPKPKVRRAPVIWPARPSWLEGFKAGLAFVPDTVSSRREDRWSNDWNQQYRLRGESEKRIGYSFQSAHWQKGWKDICKTRFSVWTGPGFWIPATTPKVRRPAC
jgi:hypothetical protein